LCTWRGRWGVDFLTYQCQLFGQLL
jgi:hypothetical protein